MCHVMVMMMYQQYQNDKNVKLDGMAFDPHNVRDDGDDDDC